MQKKHKITITEIAERAGVSKTAVSFAFNNPSKISKATLERIMKVCMENGYVPNPSARTLATKKTGIIGMLFPQKLESAFENPYYAELLRGAGSVCSRSGYLLTLITPVSDDINNAVRIAAVDAFIAVGLEQRMQTFNVLRNRKLPFVCVDVMTTDSVPGVSSDDREGARRMMAEVLTHGHRKIAVITLKGADQYKEPDHPQLTDIRLEGAMEAVNSGRNNGEKAAVSVFESGCSIQDGYESACKIFSSGMSFTAVVCMSDIVAAGVLKYCDDKGISVPDVLSVCGFDNLGVSEITNPPLTTVAQPVFRKGVRAAEIILSAIEGSLTEDHVVFDTELVIRKSLGPVRECGT